MPVRSLRLTLLAGLTAAAVGSGAFVATVVAEAAVAGCRVSYQIGAQWSGGFTANVGITNLGDPLTGWTLNWDFTAGQQVTQAWGASVTQNGARVTAVNTAWNGQLGTNATTSMGFNGSWNNSANPVPPSFTLNGVACTGAVTGSPTPSPTPTQSSPPPTGDPWTPPARYAGPLAQVWQRQEQTYNNGNLYGFRNYGWDQLMANGGSINYCVRWDSRAHVTAAQRDQIHAALQRQYQKWMNQMLDNGRGWHNWPYTTVPVRVVGWRCATAPSWSGPTTRWTSTSTTSGRTHRSAASRAAGTSTGTATTPAALVVRHTTTTTRCG